LLNYSDRENMSRRIYIYIYHYGPGVDSASNRNEYQECFRGVQAAGSQS
jgi:hypothetical protein